MHATESGEHGVLQGDVLESRPMGLLFASGFIEKKRSVANIYDAYIVCNV